ncbi:hypothetical protein GGF48_005607 [Coemansia sp. RSA 921]|nr:hypothetical protein GGF48_005607 [Coemansia sp. RSA 921]
MRGAAERERRWCLLHNVHVSTGVSTSRIATYWRCTTKRLRSSSGSSSSTTRTDCSTRAAENSAIMRRQSSSSSDE